MIRIAHADMLEAIPRLVAEGTVCDACVTDPPYHLVQISERSKYPVKYGKDGAMQRLLGGFMNQTWDGGDIAFRPDTWATIATILRPGAFLAAFGGTRTYHRLASAIEDAGFVIQDTIAWLYGTGFPKRRDMLKPAFEPIVLAYKPGGKRTMQIDECRIRPEGAKWDADQNLCALCAEPAENQPKHQTQAITASTATSGAGQTSSVRDTTSHPGIGRTDIGCSAGMRLADTDMNLNTSGFGEPLTGQSRRGLISTTLTRIAATTPSAICRSCGNQITSNSIAGRWPANLCHDGSDEVLAAFPQSAAASGAPRHNGEFKSVAKGSERPNVTFGHDDNGGSAARFFFSAKAGAEDRWGSRHPTVKPVELIRWLVKLTVPPGGTFLDPFAGSGTAAVAALAEGRNAILIEREPQYVADIRERLAFYEGAAAHSAQAKHRNRKQDHGPLFAEPFDEAADAIGSYNEAIRAIGERVKAGAPVPPFLLPLQNLTKCGGENET